MPLDYSKLLVNGFVQDFNFHEIVAITGQECPRPLRA